MLHVRHRLGNLHASPELRNQIELWRTAGALDEVTIEERDAHKSRQRFYTGSGRELGLILPRGAELRDGDIFAVEEDGSNVLIHIALQEVMVLTPLAPLRDQERWQWAVRLGHVLGNQHWPVAVLGEQILTPVTVDRAVMETVLRTHHITEHFTIHYERRSWPKTEETQQWTTHHS
jgi:urease accessory protein